MNKAALTHKIHSIAMENGLPFNTVLTYFFMESILCKLVNTDKNVHFIFKGGFLLSNHLGLGKRSTVDIDLLLRNSPLEKNSLMGVIQQVCSSAVVPDVQCIFQSIEPIRAQDAYGGYRVKILCQFENIRQAIPLDIASGDPIIPGPVSYSYKSLFFDEVIAILSYNLETILAEKLETIYKLGLANSRSKDFYDVFIIWRMREQTIDRHILSKAIERTFSHRGTPYNQDDFVVLLREIGADNEILSRWQAWVRRNAYAKDIAFSNVIKTIAQLIDVVIVDSKA